MGAFETTRGMTFLTVELDSDTAYSLRLASSTNNTHTSIQLNDLDQLNLKDLIKKLFI